MTGGQKDALGTRDPSSRSETANPQPKRDALPFHPACAIFPLIEGDEFDALVADIKQHKLREPIDVHDGKIIDGRNRYRACEKAGVEPRFTPFQGDEKGVVAYIISKNIHRRHLTARWKRELLEQLIKQEPERSDRQTAKMAGVSQPHVGKVRKELEKSGDVKTVITRTDTKGRKQPASKLPKVQASCADKPVLKAEAAPSRDQTRRVLQADFAAHDMGPTVHQDLANEIISIGYKTLADRAHPDKGGSDAQMAMINIARDLLRSDLERVGRRVSVPAKWWQQPPDAIAQQMAKYFRTAMINAICAQAIDLRKATQAQAATAPAAPREAAS